MRIVFAFLLLSATPVHADVSDARAHYEAATADYALGKYADAATEYEKAFAIKPDPALLYNAAQAHRLAGNKKRALLLYENYVLVFGGEIKNKEEVRRLILNLKKAIATDEQATVAPPTTPQPAKVEPAPAPAPTPPPAPPPEANPVEPTPAPAAAGKKEPEPA
jgi:tetratricopeptide (TPR) repeat protein